MRIGELCPVGWKPGQSTLTSYDEWLAAALPRLSKEVLVKTTEELQTVTFSAGEVVIEQGDEPEHFYIVVSGEVEVIRSDKSGKEKILATIKSGDFFGEIGLLTESRRNATLRAKTDLEVLTMDWEMFKEVVKTSEATAADFAEIIRERLAKA